MQMMLHAGVGSLTNVHDWWDKIVSLGPAYGYHANAIKTKEKTFQLFQNTNTYKLSAL